MEKEEILKYFNDFISHYDHEQRDKIWELQSNTFKTFWNQKVLNDGAKELDDFEIDSIIRFLDRNARGNTAKDEAVAKVMIPQGVWRKMFNQFRTDKKLAQLIGQIMGTFDVGQRIKLIDELYKYNEPYRNSLTGQSGSAVNAFIFLWSPSKNVSIVSLKDRQRLIQFLKIQDGPNFENDSPGEKIVRSNEVLVSKVASIFGNQYSPRTICRFFYYSPIKDIWRAEDIGEEGSVVSIAPEQSIPKDPSLFYMERHLEDFLIKNWERTELGKKYDLIEEDNEVVSPQYRTEIGVIDILAQDKGTQQLVVIELKKNQTSDATVGQVARYMGWLEENKTNGKPTKAVIIAAQFDNRLYYALKKMKDVEVYLYKIDFKLEEFKK